MQHQHNIHLFAESPAGYVGICDGCQSINVAFQSALFCLTYDQFDGFCEMIHDRIAMRPFETSHGKDRLMLTPMPNLFLVFSEAELDELDALLTEAAPVVEAKRILNVRIASN